MFESKALPGSFKRAVSHLLCSASLISAAWSQSPQPHIVVGQVQISTVTEPLKLGEPNPISLQSSGPKITSVNARWLHYVNNVPIPSGEDDSVLPVSADSNGLASVNVIPPRLGKLQLMLFVFFEDGGFERKTIDLQVGQSAGPPEKLVIALGGTGYSDTPVLYLDLSGGQKTIKVYLAAIYKDVKYPIPLNASDVSYKLINSTGAAKIDPSTGIITSWNVGQALLETSFGGVSTLTCIDMTNGVPRGPRSRCEELLPPGRHLPPSAWELDPTPPPQVKVHRP